MQNAQQPMTYYAAITITCFVQYLFIRGLTSFASKLTGFFVIALFTAFSGLRGMVGTDTWMYRLAVEAIGNGQPVVLEPGFVFLAKIFTSLTDDTALAGNAFSILFFVLAAIYLFRATRTEMIYLLVFFAPQYFIIYSFNGIRIGIASITFILALQFWQREKRVVAALLLAFAVTMQHTIILAIGIYFIFIEPIGSRKAIFMRLMMTCILGGSIFVLNEYVSNRIGIYSEVERINALSGLSYLIKYPLLLMFIWQLPMKKNQLQQKFILSIVMLATGMLISSQSYAGLRILDIITWLTPLLFIYSLERGKNAGRQFHAGLAVVGFVGALGVLKNISTSDTSVDMGGSPFLPYHFMWEIM